MYVERDRHGRGVGRLLLERLLGRGPGQRLPRGHGPDRGGRDGLARPARAVRVHAGRHRAGGRAQVQPVARHRRHAGTCCRGERQIGLGGGGGAGPPNHPPVPACGRREGADRPSQLDPANSKTLASWPCADSVRPMGEAAVFPVGRAGSLARACREAMIEPLPGHAHGRAGGRRDHRRVRRDGAVAGAGRPGPADAADFFGRIDTAGGEVFRIGKRHIDDGHHQPGGRRLAGGRGRAVLPGDGARPARPRAAPALQPPPRATWSVTTTSTSTIPTAWRWPAASPTPCWPRWGPPAPARCARSSPPSRPSRTTSSERRSTPASSSRAGRGRARPPSGCTGPPTCCSSTATVSSRSGVLVRRPQPGLPRLHRPRAAVARRAVGAAATLADLTRPRFAVTVTDPPAVATLKGDARWATVIERAALARIRLPDEPVRFGHGLRHVTVAARRRWPSGSPTPWPAGRR